MSIMENMSMGKTSLSDNRDKIMRFGHRRTCGGTLSDLWWDFIGLDSGAIGVSSDGGQCGC